jgi:hypothetical protein
MFLTALHYVSMFIQHPLGVSYYLCGSNKINKMETFTHAVIANN